MQDHAFLTLYKPYNDFDFHMKTIAQDFLTQHPKAFHRNDLPGHFTASALILNAERTHLLLMHHKKLDLWLQPGGHCEDNEPLEKAARRETFEEVGIAHLGLISPAPFDLDCHGVPAFGLEPPHTHYDVRYLYVSEKNERPQSNSESLGLRWVPLNELGAVNVKKEDSWGRVSEKLISWLKKPF